MQNVTALIINDDNKILESLKLYLSEHCKIITTIYISNCLIDSQEVIKEKKPDILLFNMSFVDYITNKYLSNYLNNIQCEIIYFNTYGLNTSDISKPISLDISITLLNNFRKKDQCLNATYFDSGVYGFNTTQVIELLDLIKKAIVILLEKRQFLAKSKEYENKKSKIIAIPSMDSIDLIEIENLLYLEADGCYTTFYLLDGTTIISSRNIGDYEKQLDSNIFFRVHYKYIVNIRMVKSINKASGNYCEIKNGKELPIAKRRQLELYRFLQLK